MKIQDLRQFFQLRNALEQRDTSALTQIFLDLALKHNCEIEITIEPNEETEDDA